jgi:hypothetical protein
LFSGTALWFLTLLSAPWFLPPRDGLVNAIGAVSILVTINLPKEIHFQSQLETFRWIAVTYSTAVIGLSLATLLYHDADPKSPTTRLLYDLTKTFAAGEILYTPPALISIFGFYQNSLAAIAELTFLWTLFVVTQPIERLLYGFRRWSALSNSNVPTSSVGTIERIDHPNIVRVRLTALSNWKPGNLYVAAVPGGDQRYVLALFTQIQGAEVMGTGLCVGPLQEPIVAAIGSVHLSHERDKAEQFLETLSGTAGAKLIGFTVENSSISLLRFEVATSTPLSEGDAIFARIDGNDVFYQILDAETTEESFDQNPRGTHIVRAAQLGVYDSNQGFAKYQWLPAMNTPLFIAKDRAFSGGQLSDREFVIGKVPSTQVSVAANIDDLIEYHTAILGVTGTGKTELGLDIVREAASRNVKVFCVDFTGDYKHRLADLSPSYPMPDDKDAKLLEGLLFIVDAYGFKAADEKKKLKDLLDKIRADTAAKMDAFLRASDNNLAIFELAEIANTKASLRLTEIYLSAIMDWARKNRGERKILLCLEEAHTIVPEAYGSGFDGETKWVVERIGQIALQGRKYGVGLLVLTQRTALVSKTILSQCNTYFTHALIDQTSLNFLEGVYSGQHAKLIPNLRRLEFLAYGKAIKAERPILLKRDFDQVKADASNAIRKPKKEDKPVLDEQTAVEALTAVSAPAATDP